MEYLDYAKGLGKLVAGTDVALENIKRNRIKMVIVTEDASDKTKNNFKYLCDENNIIFLELGEKEKLSKSIGDKNKVVIGIKDENFAEAIEKLLKGGDFKWEN